MTPQHSVIITAKRTAFEFIISTRANHPRKPFCLFTDGQTCWQEQIPFLVKLGYRVMVPTLRGFGETDAPAETSAYGERSLSNDFAALIGHLQILPSVVVIGHDWGGLSAWRFSQIYPERVNAAVASFCTPYVAPPKQYIPLEVYVQYAPNFKYQVYLTTPAAEAEINANLEAFFKRFHRPVKDFDGIMNETTGTVVMGRPEVPKSDAIPQKVLDYYVAAYRKRGVGGSLNLYKRREVNYEECKDLDPIINKPALMVTAELDPAMPPSMVDGIEKFVPNVEVQLVEGAGHWVLWEKPAECNAILEKWLSNVYPIKPNA